MGNLGQAIAHVEFYKGCFNIAPNPNQQNFDLYGPQLRELILRNKDLQVNGIDFIFNNENFIVMKPSHYKTEFANYLALGEQLVGNEVTLDKRESPRLEWHVNGMQSSMANFWKRKLGLINDKGDFVATQTPIWKTIFPLRSTNIRALDPYQIIEAKSGGGSSVAPTPTSGDANAIKKVEANVAKIQQTKGGVPDLWWAAETNIGFGSIPYAIDISTAKKVLNKDGGGVPNFILIRINRESGKSQSIDLLLINSKIYLCDWSKIGYYNNTVLNMDFSSGSDNDRSIEGPFIVDTKLTYSDSDGGANVNIEIMPCLGSIVIFSNQSHFIYKRYAKKYSEANISKTPSNGEGSGASIDLESVRKTDASKEEEFEQFVLKTNTVSVDGSNCSATVCVSAIEFDSGHCATGQFGANEIGSDKRDKIFNVFPELKSMSTSNEYPEYYLLPGISSGGNNSTPKSGASCKLWGGQPIIKTIDSEKVYDPPMGEIAVEWKDMVGGDKMMVISMLPTNPFIEKGVETGSDFVGNGMWYSGVPFLHRIRGYYYQDNNDIPNSLIMDTYDVMSLNQNYEAEDIYSISQSADITLYYSQELRTKLSLEKKSYGIKIFLNWVPIGSTQTISIPCFAGVTLDTSVLEIAGKETISIHCEDGMRILQDNPVINSPYYDGTNWFTAIKNLAEKAGIISVKDDSTSEMDYFLPCGYSFQEPKMRFSPNQTIKECISTICQLYEKIFYFDTDGVLRCSDLQGGIAFSGAEENAQYKYYRDPSMGYDVILGEKKTEKLIGSTVNAIMVTSIDRESGKPLIVSHHADFEMPWNSKYKTQEIIPPYRKIFFLEQNAFGAIEPAQKWIAMVAERMYKVPSKISFKTASTNIVLPLSMISVDGKKFRSTSCQRSFNADDNSISTTISGEWLGPPEEQ